MTRWWKRYAAFWGEREAPDSLAMLRITFSLALILNLLEQFLAGDILEFYALPEAGGIFPLTQSGAPLMLFRWFAPTPLAVWLLVLGQLMAAVFLLVGLFTRLAALICLIIQITLSERMWVFAFGGDNVFCVFLYLMVLAPAGAAWSLDSRWLGWGRAEVPRWPRRLFVFQLTVIYVATGLMKIGSTWSILGNWSALYLAVNLPGIARWPGDWAAWVFPLTQVGTFVGKWWETTFFLVPINLYLRRKPGRPGRGPLRRLLARWDLRLGYLLFGLVFHICLIVLFDLGVFSVAMIGVYPCLLHPHESRRLLVWARSWCRFPTGTEERAGFQPAPRSDAG
jgi:HTTM domain